MQVGESNEKARRSWRSHGLEKLKSRNEVYHFFQRKQQETVKSDNIVKNSEAVATERPSICDAIAELRRDGFAVCRIASGGKNPDRAGYTVESREPNDFHDGDGVGLVCGPPSAPEGSSLVCVDCDGDEALALADKHLPQTGMVDGRVGRRRAHF